MKQFYEEEQIERIFAEMHRGNYQNFFILVSLFIDTLATELMNFTNFDDLAPIGLFSLFCAIKSYNREKQSNASAYIKKYIRLSLLVHQENQTKLDIHTIELSFPSYGIVVTNAQFNQYLEKIKEKYFMKIISFQKKK